MPQPAPGAWEEFLPALQEFSKQVTAKFAAQAPGEPEDQLKAPVDALFSAFSGITHRKVVLKGESVLRNRLGRPDYAAHDPKLLIGYVELKAPGKGASPEKFKGHDREQWARFRNVPNLIYTDGNEWALFRDGKPAGTRVGLAGDVQTDGAKAAGKKDAEALFHLLAEFTSWTPIVPKQAETLAGFLAPFCRLIREDVLEALADHASPLQTLKTDIKNLLFLEATDDQFADAYAQTVVFGLLLAHMEGADVLDLNRAYQTLSSHHLLMSRSLQFLTDPQALKEIASSVALAQRVIHEIPVTVLKGRAGGEDPWLFFYEHFLAAYDPALRKAWGVYYTPVQVVNCQVRLIDEILSRELGREMGFVEPGVLTLDPALGTATYLLGVIEHALKRVEQEEGAGAVKGGARNLGNNLFGFEWMVGPYSVAQMRFSRALTSRGAALPPAGPGIFLTNTLESPHTKPVAQPLFHEPIAQEHRRALLVKDSSIVLVCLGNPPYGRHKAGSTRDYAVSGGWVRYADATPDHPKGTERPILEDFLEPARKAGHGRHLKNLYNLYIYFMRWALWKVFEHTSATGPGVVSFITASSYLEGDAFSGVREHLRKVCDRIDVIDLGGEGRGTRQDENVFAIQTPVCIFIGWRREKPASKTAKAPAEVRYVRIEGTREEKLRRLDAVHSRSDLKWKPVPSDWQAPFRPAVRGGFTKWPDLTDLFPWQSNGVQTKRTWPIGPSKELLEVRWRALLKVPDRAAAMRDSGDRSASLAQRELVEGSVLLPAIQDLEPDEACKAVVPYAYRSFDRQWLIADNRLISRPRPPLWLAHGERQLYITSLLYETLGRGPALTVASDLPDLHYFCNRGAKDVIPLYRDAGAHKPNLNPCVLTTLAREYDRSVTAEDLVGYVYAMLAQPEYTARFEAELVGRKVRVPLTKNARLFYKASEFGKRLVWLHTYGERFSDERRAKGQVPRGTAKCVKAVPDSEAEYPKDYKYLEEAKVLLVGSGRFGPVEREVFDFEVSGLKVVQSWLGYRMRERSGRKSSPLDEIGPKVWTHQLTHELLELLWVLEHTLSGYPKQKELLDRVLEGPLFNADSLPPVPPEARRPPKAPVAGDPKQAALQFE